MFQQQKKEYKRCCCSSFSLIIIVQDTSLQNTLGTTKLLISCTSRTNGAIKEYWRGPMKRKLNSYLASGLLDQFPDSLENMSESQKNDLDLLKETKGLSDRNEMSSAVPTSSKSELGFTEIGENADVSEGESADLMYVRGVDAPSAEAPQKIIDRSEQHAKTKRKLDFLSSPVELKASTFVVNSPRPLQEREQVIPAVDGICPSNGFHYILPEVPSDCADTILSQTGSYQHSDIYSTEFSDPCSLELDISDLMEMSYFDNLMIFPPGSPHDGNSI
jgi:myb proto-oncogene protein